MMSEDDSALLDHLAQAGRRLSAKKAAAREAEEALSGKPANQTTITVPPAAPPPPPPPSRASQLIGVRNDDGRWIACQVVEDHAGQMTISGRRWRPVEDWHYASDEEMDILDARGQMQTTPRHRMAGAPSKFRTWAPWVIGGLSAGAAVYLAVDRYWPWESD